MGGTVTRYRGLSSDSEAEDGDRDVSVASYWPESVPFHMPVHRHLTGADVMNQACRHWGIEEDRYFGLQFICDAHTLPKSWVDLRGRIRRQRCWCGSKAGRLLLAIKFFVGPSEPLRDSTRLYMLAQCRAELGDGPIAGGSRSELCSLVGALLAWAALDEDDCTAHHHAAAAVIRSLDAYCRSCTEYERAAAQASLAQLRTQLTLADDASTATDSVLRQPGESLRKREREIGAMRVLWLLDGYGSDVHPVEACICRAGVARQVLVVCSPLGVEILDSEWRPLRLLVHYRDRPHRHDIRLIRKHVLIRDRSSSWRRSSVDKWILLRTDSSALAQTLYSALVERLAFYVYRLPRRVTNVCTGGAYSDYALSSKLDIACTKCNHPFSASLARYRRLPMVSSAFDSQPMVVALMPQVEAVSSDCGSITIAASRADTSITTAPTPLGPSNSSAARKNGTRRSSRDAASHRGHSAEGASLVRARHVECFNCPDDANRRTRGRSHFNRCPSLLAPIFEADDAMIAGGSQPSCLKAKQLH